MTRNKPTLSEILAQFKDARTKLAEEAPAEDTVVVANAAPAVCPECGHEPCICEQAESAPVNSADLAAAAEAVQEAEGTVVDAAVALRDVADEYIAQHDTALEKEAAVFGRIFADSVLGRFAEMNESTALMQHAYAKTAEYIATAARDQASRVFDDAYLEGLSKIAELLPEEYEAAMAAQTADAPEEAPAEEPVPEWLKDSISDTSEAIANQSDLLSQLVDAYQAAAAEVPAEDELPEEAPAEEEQPAEADVDPAALEAYREALARLQQEQPAPEAAPAQAPVPPEMMQQAPQGAY